MSEKKDNEEKKEKEPEKKDGRKLRLFHKSLTEETEDHDK